ncbi:NADPH oxidase regulator NoxR [Purpureocillium lilacinum]|uniref:NADPH oxidase regulator NoxR n=1 Tax=Purpureocillium lilacinum TaxID=33203 RepID=A0A179GMB8_PURLI|nr:NADPH oxidase regulator NoxR [Purpureocillium lilacinum]KAK4084038.1 hypothetical protein Purlil1_10535 [Purpureocillium lilacinum]OAQ79047.1 NADPH oxidase regulator NoxR [Purpureocillium lilacinum]OAQ93199.1 NADPH oxidase regulator NoxR [Purpureocillium lilacinum]GJN82447.1 hypothetical protein PLIIFM63780_005987 [Purpureocillium lilacinum]
MSLKQEIETWVAALGRYDNNEFDDALGEFDKISDTSKILFNMGVIHATLGEHEKAVECYQRAIRLDQYLAVAYFQQGVSNFLLGDFEEALANFNDTLLYLRGNTMIDYAQLGLLFKLYSCEVLFNRGLCYIYLQQRDVGMQDLSYAVKEKVVEDHDVIDEAIREEAEGYTVFSIPVGVVYRPNEAKVRNLKTKDYLGKARLVAASDRSNAFTGFAGSEIKNAGKSEVKDDRPADNISFAATNLVKPGIQSRRQQSEPPTNRNVFPPTPPPENDRPSRGASVRNGPKPMPAKLSIPSQESGRRYEKAPSPEDGRARPGRSASAAPGRGYSQRDPVQAPAPLQRSSPLARRPTRTIDEEEAYPGELYDMYQTGGGSRNSRGSRRSNRRQQQRYIEEEDEGSDYDDGSLDEPEFEMISSNRRVPGSSSGSRAASRRPEIRKVRVKAHSDDVRYIMIGTAIEFPDLVDRVRDKFGLRRRFKIKIKDEDMPEGDMITMGDQDDLEMAVQSAISAAKRQRLDVAKMEIWIFEV